MSEPARPPGHRGLTKPQRSNLSSLSCFILQGVGSGVTGDKGAGGSWCDSQAAAASRASASPFAFSGREVPRATHRWGRPRPGRTTRCGQQRALRYSTRTRRAGRGLPGSGAGDPRLPCVLTRFSAPLRGQPWHLLTFRCSPPRLAVSRVRFRAPATEPLFTSSVPQSARRRAGTMG